LWNELRNLPCLPERKNRCPGCRKSSADKAVSVQRCIIVKCTYLKKPKSKFCYECEKFPCKRMNQLDKRYRTKYRTSFIENLVMIKKMGLQIFWTLNLREGLAQIADQFYVFIVPFVLTVR